MIVTFEEFCDVAKDIQGNYSESSVPYETGKELLEGLLDSTAGWVATHDQVDLLERIKAAQQVLEEA